MPTIMIKYNQSYLYDRQNFTLNPIYSNVKREAGPVVIIQNKQNKFKIKSVVDKNRKIQNYVSFF